MKILTSAIVMLIVLMPLAAAQEDIVSPGITSESSFYGIDRAFERVRLSLAFNTIARARLHYRFAEERLAEAQALSADNQELAQQALGEYEDGLSRVNNDISDAAASGEDITDITDEMSNRSFRHIQVLRRVYQIAPDRAKPSIENSMRMSLGRYGESVMNADRELVNVTIIVGDRTFTVLVPAKMAERIVEHAEDVAERQEERPIANVELKRGNFRDLITRCENLIERLRGVELDSAGQVLLRNAELHLANAKLALEVNRTENETISLGRAFGQTIAACRNAENAARHRIGEEPTNRTENETENAAG